MKFEDRLLAKLVEMDLKMDTLATREEMNERFREVYSILDGHTVMLKRLDAERLATIVRLDRLEGVA